MKAGQYLMMARARERNVSKPPKGFDITLVQVMDDYNLTEAQLKHLGELTADKRSSLAHASVGNMVWYRRHQIEELIVNGQ